MSLFIPKGKILRIFDYNSRDNITGEIPLILTEDITLSLSSRFSPLIGNQTNKLLSIIGQGIAAFSGGTGGFSGSFKQFGFQVWEGTDPISFTANIEFFRGINDLYDAEQEVYIPMTKLMQIPLPGESRSLGLVAPGPFIGSIFQNADSEDSDRIANYNRIAVDIGNILSIDNAIISRAEPTFSSDVDDNDYPIWGKIALTISSVYTATKSSITNRSSVPPSSIYSGVQRGEL